MREELEKYNEYKFRLKILKRQLREEEESEATTNGSNFEINGDIRPKGYVNNNIEKQIAKKVDKIEKIKKEIKDIEEKIEVIEEGLKVLKQNDRRAIEMKFFDRVSYRGIASTFGLASSKEAEQKVRKAVERLDGIYRNTVKIQ